MLHRLFTQLYRTESIKKSVYNKLHSFLLTPSIGIFSLALSVGQAAETSDSFQKLLISWRIRPPDVVTVCKYVEVGSAVLFASYIISLLVFQTGFLSRQLFYRKIKVHLRKLIEINVDQSTLQRMYEVGYAENGEGFAPLELMKSHYAANKEGFRCWISNIENKNKKALKAFYIISPLTQIGTDRILNKDIRGAAKIEPRMIAKKFRDARSIYITELYASSYPFDACALVLLFEEVIKRAKDCKNLQYLFARPVSEFGIDHLESNGFKQLSASPTEIWMKEISELKAFMK